MIMFLLICIFIFTFINFYINLFTLMTYNKLDEFISFDFFKTLKGIKKIRKLKKKGDI